MVVWRSFQQHRLFVSLLPHACSVEVIEGLMFSVMTSMRATPSFSSLATLTIFVICVANTGNYDTVP